MYIFFSNKFEKRIQKQPRKIQIKFKERYLVFQEDQFHYSLNNHALTGKFKGIRSFNVTGDIRVHYKEEKDRIIFIDISSHAELY
ncbi:MAG: type II toxin-antitoxin system YafQ family toxin [Bacteriovoracia bacterium]